ncbi:MAG TPA: baseplate J/gp47 family protein [Pyrinomonadaceae bacterium]|jgi:hypothetical protein
MSIALPNLDDRNYSDLVEEARALIPKHAPEWTNHNPSDPGITLIELFAYLAEMLIYRLNQVSDANIYVFLKLLNGPEWERSKEKSLSEEVRDTVLALRRPHRAVSCQDFEDLALEAALEAAKRQKRRSEDSWEEVASALSGFEETLPPPRQPLVRTSWEMKRAHCVPERNLESQDNVLRYAEAPGHMSVVIIPSSDETNRTPRPTTEMIQAVQAYLEERRLVTTRVHVVGPRYLKVGVRFILWLTPDVLDLPSESKSKISKKTIRDSAERALKRFLHPVTGGPDGKGWPFGRNVYVSELYELLDVLPAVNYVDNIDPATGQAFAELSVDESHQDRLIPNSKGEIVAVDLRSDELVDANITLTIMYPGKS